MAKSVLIIFVKNPVEGKVKTRLAKSIGDEAALKVYESLLDKTFEAVEPLDGDKWLFFSDEINPDMWEGYPKLMQRGEDLGERMQNAIQDCLNLGYQRLVVIGTDLEELTPELIVDAFKALNDHQVVLGPAEDGGYYLLGVNNMYPELFESKPWSTDALLKETISVLDQKKISYTLLEEKNDIDTLEDLKGSSLQEEFRDVIDQAKEK